MRRHAATAVPLFAAACAALMALIGAGSPPPFAPAPPPAPSQPSSSEPAPRPAAPAEASPVAAAASSAPADETGLAAPDAAERFRAVRRLAASGRAAARHHAAIVAAAKDEPDPELRRMMARLAGSLAPEAERLLVAEGLRDLALPDPSVRFAAARRLAAGGIAARAALGGLRLAEGDVDRDVAAAAVSAHRTIAAAVDAEVVAQLDRLAGAEAAERLAAAKRLSLLGWHARAAIPALNAAVADDPDADVRTVAERAVAVLLDAPSPRGPADLPATKSDPALALRPLTRPDPATKTDPPVSPKADPKPAPKTVPVPDPKATSPSPDGVIKSADAVNHLGMTVVVEFRVAAVGKARTGTFWYVNSDDFRAAANLAVAVNPEGQTSFQAAGVEDFEAFSRKLSGKTVRVRGTVSTFRGATQIIVTDAKQIEVVGGM